MNGAVLTRAALPRVPTPRLPVEDAVRSTAAVAYQRVVHQAVRREFRLLADLAGWAVADDVQRVAQLTEHADLLARVLMQHHATERAHLWPALLRNLPTSRQDAAGPLVTDWTSRAALLDHSLRDLSTVARQWAAATTPPARDGFARACDRVADAVDAHTAAEETSLLPLLARYLPDGEWTAVRRAARTSLSGREQMLVLGLALEDACALDRARLMAGLSPAARTAWRVVGRRNFRATVVRLRGAPPAA
ncbi:MAG: hemerythrin protein [Blastococcus sp.]|nr:hemerythrin protein [Blastococcus sp.]